MPSLALQLTSIRAAHTGGPYSHTQESMPSRSLNPNPNSHTQEEKNDLYVSQMFDQVKVGAVKKVRPNPNPNPNRSCRSSRSTRGCCCTSTATP